MEKKKEKREIDILKIILIFMILGAFCLIIFISYANIQELIFTTNKTILFIDNYNQNSGIILIIGFLPPLSLLIFSFKNYFFLKENSFFFRIINNLKVLLVSSIVVSVLCLIVILNCYSYIDEDGILIKKNIFSNQSYYTYSQIDHVEVAAEYGHTKGTTHELFVNYVLYFDDNSKINIAAAYDFWNKISEVDNLLTRNKVEINREALNNDKYMELEGDYLGQNIQFLNNKIQKIFKFEYSFKFN